MAELQLRSTRFRIEREEEWRRLERILRKAESGSLKSLTDEELLALPVLYRSALSSLSVARATLLDKALIDYLESLATRAYFFVYGVRSDLRRRVTCFFREDWREAVRALSPEIAVAGVLLVIGAVLAFVLVRDNPAWFYAIIPGDLAGGRDPGASAEELRSTLYADDAGGAGVFSTWLFVHNAQVSLVAFALGFAFGLPTALLVIFNGAMMGALAAVFVQRGLGVELFGWLLIHGVTELLAVAIAAGAGFRIGRSVAFPGALTRLESARRAGRSAARAMAGVLVMLIVAGVLEGFARQAVTQDAVRYGVAAATAVVWGLYFWGPRPRRRAPHGPR
jgi:uncharacterized membrane protein SpoIIM required for sporulation